MLKNYKINNISFNPLMTYLSVPVRIFKFLLKIIFKLVQKCEIFESFLFHNSYNNLLVLEFLRVI